MTISKTTVVIINATLAMMCTISLPVLANDIESSYQVNFKDQYRATRTEKIELWEQPKTQGTPSNLVSEQQMRLSGYNENDNSYESYTMHITDYDTYIVDSFQKDGEYYVKDNLGRVFKTSSRALTPEQMSQLNRVEMNSQAIYQNRQDIDRLDNRIDDVHNQLEQGLATVTALTSLHPNPKATGRTQLAIGSGMYRDNVAGAVGLFHHVNDNVMLSAGAAYGGGHEWAGNIGMTFSFGSNNKNKRKSTGGNM